MYQYIKKIIATLIGTGTMGFALSVFLIPAMIAPGGVSGFATVINHITGISVGILVVLINIPIFILGVITFDRSFLGYAIFGTISLSASIQIFAEMPALITEPLSAAVFGGTILGLGLGIVLRFGGTTGGTDILAMVLKKLIPSLTVGELFMVIDGVVLTLAGLAFGSLEVVLYSALALFISSRILDVVLIGGSFAKMVYIISDSSVEISNEILVKLKRGVTALNSVAMYTGNKKKVLLCVLRKTELPRLKKIIEEIDNEAFMIISDAKEVLGKGFDENTRR